MRSLWLGLLVLFAVAAAGCELVGDILEVGFWAGAIMVLLVIAVVGFLISKLRG